MNRFGAGVLTVLAAGLLLLPAAVPAATGAAGEMKILVLLSSGADQYAEALEGFKEVFEEAVKAVRFEVHDLSGDPAGAAKSLKVAPANVEMVFALGSPAAEVLSRQRLSIPAIVGMVPREREIRRTGKRATGVFLEYPYDIQFSHLRRFLPLARRVGVVYSTDENEKEIPHAADAAAKEGFELVALRVAGPQGLPGALEILSRRVDVLWAIQDSLLLNVSTAKGLILFSFRNRIPFVGLSPAWVRAGALYSMSWDYRDIGRQCAEAALDIVAPKGSVPPPPASPRRVLYSVNRKTARQMKLEIGDSILSGARETY